LVVVVEEFMVRVFTGSKVTVPKKVLELFSVEYGILFVKELAKTSISAEEILAKLKEQFEDIGFIHLSFKELLEI